MITGLKYSNILLKDTTSQESLSINDVNFFSHAVPYNKSSVKEIQNGYDTVMKAEDEQFIALLLKHKKNESSLDSNLIAPAIRYSLPGLVVFERPPTYQMVQYISRQMSDINENHTPEVYRIAIPWQLYIIFYDPIKFYSTSVKMFFMQSSLRSMDQRLFMPPLPNFFTNGMLCRPMYDKMDDVDGYSKDLSGVIASAHDWIWNSGFNHDLSETIQQVRLQSMPVEIASDKAVKEVSDFHGSSRSVTPIFLNRVFKAWEKIDIKDILNLTWPNPSLSHTFEADPEYYSRYDSDRFDISCEENGCSEENCECYPSLREQTQTYDTVITASLNIDYANSPSNRNLDKSFLTIFELISPTICF